MFVYRDLCILRGVLPAHEYKQILHRSNTILYCMNTSLIPSNFDDGSFEYLQQTTKFIDVIAMCGVSILSLASKIKLDKYTTKFNIYNLKIIEHNYKINYPFGGVRDEYTRLVVKSEKHNINIKKAIIRAAKFKISVYEAQIIKLYNILIDYTDSNAEHLEKLSRIT